MRIVFLLVLLCCQVLEASAAWQLQREQAAATGTPALRVVTKSVTGVRPVRLHLVVPEPEQTRLVVLDNPDNAHWLDESMGERGCLAGANGGYFHPDMRPIGLVVSEGRKIHGFERAQLLSGVLAVRDGLPALLRVAEFSPEAPLSDGLQAGPFLVDHGRPVSGLEATKRARRTAIVADAAGRYALVVTDSHLTLAELASLLVTPKIIHELRVTRALNLDGGSSSAIWARTDNSVLYRSEGKRVRNFLCVLAHPENGAS